MDSLRVTMSCNALPPLGIELRLHDAFGKDGNMNYLPGHELCLQRKHEPCL